MESVTNNKLNDIGIDKILKLLDEKLEHQLNKLTLTNYKHMSDYKTHIDNMAKLHSETVNKMQERFDTLFELVVKLRKDNNIPMDDEVLINN